MDKPDVYAVAREEYRKKLMEQVSEIAYLRIEVERLIVQRSGLVDRIDERDAEIKRLRAALEYIGKGGLAYPEKHAMAAISQATGNNHE